MAETAQVAAQEHAPAPRKRTRKRAPAETKATDPLAFMDVDRRALATVRQYVTNLRKKEKLNAAYIRRFINGVCEAVEKE